MTIKEIIKTAAVLLGEDKLYKDLTSGEESVTDAEVLSEINLFTQLSNLLIDELSATYIPLKKEEKIYTADGKIRYSDLKENAVKILGVYDRYGEKTTFTQFTEYMIAAAGELTVSYAYTPSTLGLNDKTGYCERDVSACVLAYGVAAEYCLSRGRFDEAVFWRKRYSDGVEAFCLPKSVKTKRRGWL